MLAKAALLSALVIAPFTFSASAQTPQTGQGQTAAKPAKPADKPLKTGEFKTEAEAKASCPTDTVVWSNFNTKVYHYAGYADYGKTKKGAYMCEKNAIAGKFRAAKNEKKKT
jgi:hypothetical protein